MRLEGPGPARREGRLKPERAGVDLAVVPGLLLLVARDLAFHDPPRVLAWRLTHDARIADAARWLGPLLPAPSGALDRDPIALVLSATAVLLALVYASLALAGARAAARAATIAAAATLLVVVPSAAFVAMGTASGRPYGQDGGVVQLPLAVDRILAGESPYAADYSESMLARQARVSSFWREWGGNPILRHHAYLPGTHLVMAPFQVGLRSAFGFFDPRLVTLLFYALATVLAARLPRAPDARLAAAALVAVNPLVYWHQIFGANDLVFVAMLLGSLLAARSGRGALAGALLGLACATKQLAWPFAPFLLLGLTGARSSSELLAPGALRALVRPLVVAAGVFVAVVAPVAALDLRAFWGDIVVYNAGLPGGDNYPLGGTPGIGFANFLIAYGGVASLRDYFPFSFFYLLLLPFGLLLVRAQTRDRAPEAALLMGSAALLATLYFSRVVHPNYLVAAAALLPLAPLVRRRRADLALVPLLLLALAVEVAENEVFRSAWEQAGSAGIPARLSGLAALVMPRAGPSLSRDPLGLVFSAAAAGLGVLYLAIGCTRGSSTAAAPTRRAGTARSVRSTDMLTLLAALLVVIVPTVVLVRIGDRTGTVRAQDRTVVQAQADAARILALRSPYTPPFETTPRGREAVSASFRLDPPAEVEPERSLLPPGLGVIAAAGRLVGLPDPRLAALLALGALAWLLARDAASTRAALVALGVVSPPLALGTTLGSPFVFSLAGLVGAWAAGRRRRSTMAGALAGLAVAIDHWTAVVALPLLLRQGEAEAAATRPWSRGRALCAAAAAYAVIVVPVTLLDPSAFLERLRQAPLPGPGLGVFNLLAYRGQEGSPLALALAALAPLLALAVSVGLIRLRLQGLAPAALASLVVPALAPALSPDAIAPPLVLLALAAAETAAHARTDAHAWTEETAPP